jgi:alpha-1,3-rhamnosyl/mannosyltransferase
MHCLIDARVLTDPNPGGVTRVARELIQSMVTHDPEDTFTLVTSGLKKPSPTLLTTPHALAPTHLSIPNKLIALSTFINLTSLDRLTPSHHDVLFLPNLEMVGKPRIPYALLIHDLSFFIEPTWFTPKSRLWHLITRAKQRIEQANALFTVSEHTKQDLLRHFNIDPTNIQTLPLTHPDLVPNTESLPSELEGTRYFLALGANDPRKNIACITTAFQELKKDPAFADVKCVLIGGRPIPRLYDSTTLFIHISRPSDALLATLMQKAAALLYPSWYEGFGLPLHEVHKYGTPVVASTSGALPETAPPGTLFVPPFKPHLWTHAMHSVLQYPKKHSIEHPPSTRDSGESAKTIINTLRRIAQTS